MWQMWMTFVFGVIALRDAVGQLGDVGRRHRERDLRDLDLVAAHALIPGVEHPPVVLVRRHHVVAGLEIDAELRDLQPLAGVARDGELLQVAADLDRELAPHRLDVRLEQCSTCSESAPGWTMSR